MEGDLIGQDVANYCGLYAKSTRMLLNKSLSKEDVLAAFNTRTQILDHAPRYRAGQYKRESDWYWMYLVRAHTNAARNGMAGNELVLARDDKRVLSCGRVQSIILRLVAEWHLERRTHIPVTHYRLKVKTEIGTMVYVPPSPVLDSNVVNITDSGQVHILDRAKIIDLKTRMDQVKSLKIVNVTTKLTKENPPAPFDSSSLMQAMSKQYKWPMKKTAAIADKVRFKGLITYFRTDDHRLPINYLNPEFVEPIFDACAYLPGMRDHINNIKQGVSGSGYSCSHVTKDKLDHQGITPTSASYLEKNLSDDEFKLYEMVARKFVMAMLPKSIKETTWVKAHASTVGVLDETPVTFMISETSIPEEGWRIMKESSSESPKMERIPEIGECIGTGVIELSDASTEPRAPMTVLDMIQQLKSPSMLAENETQLKTLRECRGIGTAATRASTFEKTKKRNYIAETDDSRVSPTKWGLDYLNYLHPELVSIGLTEVVENSIRDIATQKSDLDAIKHRDIRLKQSREFITKHVKIALEGTSYD
jgi:DNA topoisomerase-3